ncbi:hypothetical protein KKC91_06440 [bacterium]|nr:hypothetical protein [bacterium]
MNRNLFAFATVDIDEGLNIRDKSDLEKYLTETVSLVRKDIHRINGKFNLFDVKVLEKDGKLIGLLDFRTTISNEDMRRKIIFYLKKLCPRGTRIYRLETAAFWDYYDIAEEQFRQIRDSFTVQ